MLRLCFIACVAVGCSDPPDAPDAARTDAYTPDAGWRDGAMAYDAARDAPWDAGTDAAWDAGTDAPSIADAFFIPDAAACELWTSRVTPPEESWCDGTLAMDPVVERQVALTFDDGPRPDTTRLVIDALREAGVPATFFVQGNQIFDEERRALVREEHEDPLFDVGNHTFSHSNTTELTIEQIEAEIEDTNALIREAIGDPCYFPRYFRFPYGAATCRETEVIEIFGLGIAGIQVDASDWCFSPDEGHCDEKIAPWVPDEFRDDLAGYVMDRLEASGGGILLLHDIQPNTARLLPEILTRIRDAGFTFVRLSDLPELNAAVHAPEPPMCCDGMVH